MTQHPVPPILGALQWPQSSGILLDGHEEPEGHLERRMMGEDMHAKADRE